MKYAFSLVLSVLLTICCSVPAMSANYVAYVQLPGMSGSVKSGPFAGWIKVTNLSYRVGKLPNASVIARGGNKMNNLNTSLSGSECQGMFVAFTKLVDKCSPKIAGYYEQKKKFPSAKLALCSSSGQQLGKFEMKGVGIMKLGKRGQGEAMTLNFEKIEFKSSPKN